MKNNIAIILGILAIAFLISGCSNTKVPVEQPDVEIISLPNDCRNEDNSTVNNCCLEECTSYCEENEYFYFKHHPNRINCACWCAA